MKGSSTYEKINMFMNVNSILNLLAKVFYEEIILDLIAVSNVEARDTYVNLANIFIYY